MMSISAHDRISGSPQMVRAWEEFLRYAQGCPGVAVMRKDEIARHALESSLTLREAEAPWPHWVRLALVCPGVRSG
jgi:hypothetical protein